MSDIQNIRDKFEKAYDELADSLFRHSFFKVSNREKAKDIVSEAFLKTWEYISSGKEVRNLKTFLYKVTDNLIIDYYRKKKDVSLDQLSEAGFDPSQSGEDIFSRAEYSQVKKILDELDERDREIIVWRFLDGLSIKEIKEVTGSSENSVSVRIHRAVNRLKEKFEPN